MLFRPQKYRGQAKCCKHVYSLGVCETGNAFLFHIIHLSVMTTLSIPFISLACVVESLYSSCNSDVYGMS